MTLLRLLRCANKRHFDLSKEHSDRVSNIEVWLLKVLKNIENKFFLDPERLGVRDL